jgi:hypothetical protein
MEKCNENSLSGHEEDPVGRLTGLVRGDDYRPGKPIRIPFGHGICDRKADQGPEIEGSRGTNPTPSAL